MQEEYKTVIDQSQANGQAHEENAKGVKELQTQCAMLVDFPTTVEKERVDLHATILDLTQRLEKAATNQQEEIKRASAKAHEYKSKLRQANAK